MRRRCPRLVLLACLALIALAPASARAQEVTVKPQGPPSDAIADLLRPPGSDPYEPAVDWSQVPPWRQTAFFDVRAQGTFFIFVVDCSGSMGEYDRLVRAKAELRRAVARLQIPQRYLVIFYNDQPLPMPGGIPVSARPDARRKTSSWLSLVEAEGETDPRGAMRMALSLRPNAVFLLSDGEYPEGSAEAIAEANARGKAKVPIHCIDLSGGAAGEDLKRIAEDSGGAYASRP
jgi:hypothetical protein